MFDVFQPEYQQISTYALYGFLLAWSNLIL